MTSPHESPQTPPPDNEQQRAEERHVFESLRNEVKKILGEAREHVNAETLRSAVDKASVELKRASRHTGETINRMSDALKKDLAHRAESMGPRWEAFSEKTADVFSVWRDRSSQFFAEAASATGEWLRQWGGSIKDQTYRTGEMSAGGTFRCLACGELTVLSKSGHLPPCHHCQKTDFRRV